MVEYSIEQAKSSRTECKRCHIKIEQGKIRLKCDYGYGRMKNYPMYLYLCSDCGKKELFLLMNEIDTKFRALDKSVLLGP